MSSTITRSFAGGEIAPALFARADQVKFQTGLKACRNFMVQRFGGVTNRPGTQFVAETNSSFAPRLAKFVFNAEQTYVLEFSSLTLRIYQDGARLTPGTVTAWSNATNYTIGDLALQGGINYYCIADHINQAPPNVAYWFPMTAGMLELPTPYDTADILELSYVQSADVLTIASKRHEPRQLKRFSATKWAIGTLETKPDLEPPSDIIVTAGTAGAKDWEYAVTAITARGAESLPGISDATAHPASVITGAAVLASTSTYSRSGRDRPITVTRTTYKVRITAVAHGFVSGMAILINDVGGMVQINGRIFKITVINANTFDLDNISNAKSFGTYTGGGTARLAGGRATGGNPTAANPNVITWQPVTGAKEYQVYREDNAHFVYIGTAGGTRFEDPNITADFATSVPYLPDLFNGTDDYPGVVAIVQQRLTFASTNDRPETIWMSRIGDYRNFTIRYPTQDDDSVSFTIAGRQVNEVRHLVELDSMVILSSGGEWIVQGDADGAITPLTINLKQIGHNGASTVDPVVIGNSCLFIQARGSIVRDLRFDVQTDGYQGRDLTVYAPHLIDGYSIVAWDYAQVPHSIAWAVRDDGTLLGLTYLREHEVWGWHRHDTGDGDSFESVVTVPEGNEDAVYVAVRRTINGNTKRYIERFASRSILTADDVTADARFLDSHLTFDGTSPGGPVLSLTGGTLWDHTESLTLTAGSALFTAGDVGNAWVIRRLGDSIRVTVTAYTSTTVVTVQASRLVPATLRSPFGSSDWTRCVDVLTGLDHLEARTVSILADGNVHQQRVVTAGSITLDRPYGVVHVGLPITAEIETLPLENVNGETLTDKKKRVNKVTLLLDASRGGFVGRPPKTLADGSVVQPTLREFKQRVDLSADAPVPLVTGPEDINITTEWDQTGGLLIRQTDPLPMTILAIVPSGIVAN